MNELFTKYKSLIVAFAVGLGLVLIGILTSRGGQTEEPLGLGTTTLPSVSSTTTTTAEAGVHNPDVRALDCNALLTLEETGDAMAVWDRPADERGSFRFSQHEICAETLEADEKVFVRIEPGDPGDFEPGATLNGTQGEDLPDVGDGARWFGGTEADGGGEVGLLSVRKETTLGDLHYRIVLGRPDLDEAAQMEIAVELARIALRRFPGVELEPVEPELITFDEDPPDRSGISLEDNLLAREEAGEWTRGEGLVATLGLVAGERDASEVLEVPEPLIRSASAVVALADEYLANGPDGAEKDDIARLLALLTPTREEVLGGLEPLSPASLDAVELESDPLGLLVSLTPVAQGNGGGECEVIGLVTPCSFAVTIPDTPGLTPGHYAIAASLGEGSAWNASHVKLAAQAIVDSATKYETLGDMPITTVVLEPGSAYLDVSSRQDGCTAHIGDFLAGYDASKFKQILARELAFCFIGEELFHQVVSDFEQKEWWYQGLGTYLSGYVYPTVNLEHDSLPSQLAQMELSTTVADRTYTNWVLFEHLHKFGGAEGNIELMKTLPASGDQLASLAAHSGMEGDFHDLELGLTDADVADIGGGLVPYDPVAWDLPVSGPTEVPLSVPRFGVRRLHITVPAGQFACFETSSVGSQKSSWRQGEPGLSGAWSTDPPSVLAGENMFVVTAVQPGAQFTLSITRVGDDPDCEDEPEQPKAQSCDLGLICDPSGYYFQLVPER